MDGAQVARPVKASAGADRSLDEKTNPRPGPLTFLGRTHFGALLFY